MKWQALWRKYTTEPKHRIRLALIAALLLALTVILVRTAAPNFAPLPDMHSYRTVPERKAAFFNYLRPIVEFHNNEILEDRNKLLAIAGKFDISAEISWWDELWLKRLANEYNVEWSTESVSESLATLKRRVDIIPTSLALVQAAKESGWGRSRFAVHGNGLFGQWCYEPGCGMVPKKRSGKALHQVQTFPTVSHSVMGYLKNVNTDERYRPLRMVRQQLREADKTPDGLSLADGLLFYSERRQAYVDEVKKMLRRYRTQQQALVINEKTP